MKVDERMIFIASLDQHYAEIKESLGRNIDTVRELDNHIHDKMGLVGDYIQWQLDEGRPRTDVSMNGSPMSDIEAMVYGLAQIKIGELKIDLHEEGKL